MRRNFRTKRNEDRTTRLEVPPALAVALILVAGCTTSMTHLTPSKALQPGHMQITVNYSIPVHTNLAEGVVDAAELLEDRIEKDELTGDLTEAEFRTMLDAAFNWALFLTAGSPELLGRVGLFGWDTGGADLGIRYNGTTVKGDLKVEFWRSSNEVWHAALDVGYGHQFAVVGDLLEYVSLTEWSRHDLDIMLPVSAEPGRVFRWYVAPRVMLSWIKAEAKPGSELLDYLPENLKAYNPSQFFGDEEMTYLGGTTGIMLGYRWVFVNLEMTVMRLLFKPKILDERKDYDGIVFAPAVGLTGMW
jgi:hypothetical protein